MIIFHRITTSLIFSANQLTTTLSCTTEGYIHSSPSSARFASDSANLEEGRPKKKQNRASPNDGGHGAFVARFSWRLHDCPAANNAPDRARMSCWLMLKLIYSSRWYQLLRSTSDTSKCGGLFVERQASIIWVEISAKHRGGCD